MEPMSDSSPAWDCEDLARHSRQKQKPTSHLHRLRNKIGLENDHLIEMQPGKNLTKTHRSLFQTKRKLDKDD